jgi:glycosyltransferase involved in cell wall biosynthesis
VQARAAGVAVFVFRSIAMNRGGLTRALLSRMRLFAMAGIKVRLLLTAQQYFEEREEADIRRAWSLPDSVEIRYFWREMTPGSAGGPAGSLAAARDEPGLIAFPALLNGQVVRFFRAGLPVKTKHFTEDGRIQLIEHYDQAGRCRSKEYFEPGGRLVYSDDLDVTTGRPAVRRWFDSSGLAWLTTWPGRTPAAAIRRSPAPAAYDDFTELVAEWVDEIIAQDMSPVVFSDGRGLDRVLLALRHPRVRTVAILHNGHTTVPYTADARIKGHYAPLLHNISAFDTVVSLTHQQRDDVKARFGGSNHLVINHPTPSTEVAAVPRAPNRLVAVARISRQKRLADAIRAFALAAPRAPDARFDIYGTGVERAKLRSLVRSLGLGDQVRFRGFTDRPLEVFAGATATVLSSRFEGFPLVLNEAMGVGTPFIAYDINYGPAEVIRHEIDGLLVPAGDITALSEAMVRVLTDPQFATSLSQRAPEVKDRFSIGRWRDEWLGLFADLVEKTLSAQPHDADSTLTDRAAPEAATRRSLSATSSATTA